MTDIFTAKQVQLISDFKHKRLKRLNILHGSIRSGKTWISLVLWALWVATQPRDKTYLMVAKTLTSLKRNCLDLLESLVGRSNFNYSLSQKQGVLFGRKIYLEGVNDARAESKIRGMTLQGAYCDELTLFTEEFFSMLLSRLSESGAKLIATTNPDNPSHWLKKNYLDRENELDLYVMQFLIDDNTTLDPEYVRQIKAENTGVFYDRFILGKWVNAEGLIYPFFDETVHCYDELPEGQYEWYVSMDYGTLNPCAMLLWAVDIRRRAAYLEDEFYYSGREKKRQLTDSEYYDELTALCAHKRIETVIIDPSAASFKTEIRKRGYFSCRDAKNNVLDGIRQTGSYLKSGRIKINRRCKNTIFEFGAYLWDEKSTVDAPIKENDHAMDACRYMANTVLRKFDF